MPREWSDDELMRNILMRHRYLNFVRRALDPQRYPRITNDPRLPPGYVATHQMSWQTIESGPEQGKNIVYPNIVFDSQTGQLKWLEGKEAIDYALRTGEYISMPTPESADWLSKHYKRGAGIGR